MCPKFTRALIFIGFVLFPAIIFAQQGENLKKQADSLYRNYEENKALQLYEQVIEEDPNNYEALWRASFLNSRVGNRADDESTKEQHFNRAIELAERALTIDSTDVQSNFVMAVAMGRKALISGAKSRVAASRDIKKYADRALEADPDHAGALHVLGRWHFKVANLGWFERAAANTLFGGIPGDASNEKAAEYIKKATEQKEDYILYYLDLAKVYEEMGQEDSARESCKEAISMESKVMGDDELKRECQELIQQL